MPCKSRVRLAIALNPTTSSAVITRAAVPPKELGDPISCYLA